MGAAGEGLAGSPAAPTHVLVDRFMRTLRELPTEMTPGKPEELREMEERARAIWDEDKQADGPTAGRGA